MTDIELLWAKSTTLTTRVRRPMGGLVSIELPPPWAAATIRTPLEWTPRVGEELIVAGSEDNRLGAEARRGFRVVAIEVVIDARRVRFSVGGDAAGAVSPPPSPDAPREAAHCGPVLVTAGLLDDIAAIGPDHRASSAIELLCALHPPRGAIARGFAHYDWHWRNDTSDPVADLAAIVEQRDRFRATRIDSGGIDFVLVAAHGERKAHADDLWELAAIMDALLEDIRAPRRLFAWETGGDRYAFLGRSVGDGEALARSVGDPALRLASATAGLTTLR